MQTKPQQNMWPTTKPSAIRAPLSEVQNAKVVVLYGIHDKYPDVCIAGWVENWEEGNEPEAVTLKEPLYFRLNHDLLRRPEGASGPIQIQFMKPLHGVPAIGRYVAYDDLEVFEGVTSFAGVYLEGLNTARQYAPTYQPAWGGSFETLHVLSRSEAPPRALPPK